MTKNNEDTIEQSLNSIVALESEILIGDLGSKDRTVEICKDLGAIVVPLSLNSNYSKVRNNLIQEGWNFYIDPWEVLVSGHEEIDKAKNGAYRFQVFRDRIISKEIRLWNNGLKFQNPVYETLLDQTATDIPKGVIYSKNMPLDEKRKEVLEKWTKENPTNIKTFYYKAFQSLRDGLPDSFISYANRYLLHDTVSTSAIMIRYYLALFQLYHKKDIDQAVRNCCCCIIAEPLMAEFWCLLGDIYYKLSRYQKARSLYENAIILGSRRPSADEWPIEIDKYKIYPEKMIHSCIEIDKRTKLYGSF